MATLKAVKAALERRIPGVADELNMVDSINIALSEIGKVTKMDESLDVVDNQTEYDLPDGVSNVVRVQVANSASADYDFQTDYNWDEVDGKLYFPDALYYDAGNTIRLFYNDVHDAVTEDADVIHAAIPVPLLCAIARYYYESLFYQDQSNMGAKEDTILQMLNNEMMLAKQRYRVRRLPMDPKLGSS